MAVGILLFLLVAIGAVGYLIFSGDSKEAIETAQQKVDKPANELTRIADIPKESIDKAKAAVDQVNAKASTDEILGSDEPVAAPAEEEKPEPSAEVAETPAPAPVPVEEGPRAVTYGQQNPDVLDWIEDLGGIQVGRGKMILNGQTYSTGAVVNQSLGIRWIGEDKALGLLYFQDSQGVKYEKEF